jgi:hypothetical protein
MRGLLHASATDCPLPKFGVTIGHSHLLALTIPIGPDRSTTIRLPLASPPRTAQQPVSLSSAQTMSGTSWITSDTTRVAPSGDGVGSEVDGDHYKSSSCPRFRLRASVSGPPKRQAATSPRSASCSTGSSSARFSRPTGARGARPKHVIKKAKIPILLDGDAAGQLLQQRCEHDPRRTLYALRERRLFCG